MPGQVQLRGGAILLDGGLVAMDPDCCCCDLFATTTYSAPNVLCAAGSISGLTTYHFRVYKNGSLVREVLNTIAAQNWTVSTTDGDEVVVTATAAADPTCTAGSTCSIAFEPAFPACHYFDPTGFSPGQCLNAAQILAAYKPTTNRTATISGLTGNMAALNGAYTVSCAAASAGANVNWSGGGYVYNYGLVTVNWIAQLSYRAEIRCLQSDLDACILAGSICNPSDATRRTGSVLSEFVGTDAYWNYSFRVATCGDCPAAAPKYYQSGSSPFYQSTSNGSPAESGSIAWS